MTLTLSLKHETSIPIEVDSVCMEVVREQSAAQVATTLVQHGNRQVELGEFFDIAGSADDEHIVWQGNCERVKLIGTHLASGSIRVEGNAGMHLGAEMTGGEITVTGNAADWCGAEMHGGRIRVHGNAGHLVGAVYRGGRRGMTGGEIVIDGSAGNEIGHTMRRGFIMVGDRSGDAPGFNMIAGSIFLCGDDNGIRPGAGMRRGSVVYLANDGHPEVLPTFRYAGTWRPTFLRFTLLDLRSRGVDVPDEYLNSEYRRFNGDFLEMGKGELLFRVA